MLIHNKKPEEISPAHCPAVSVLNWGTTKVNFNWRYERNSPFWYAYYNLTPGALIEVGGREIELTPDIILLLPPHTPFVSRKVEDFEQLWFHFTIGGSMDIKSEPVCIPSASYLTLLERICQETEANTFLLCGFLTLLMSEIPLDQWIDVKVSYWDKRMQQALSLLSKNKSVAVAARNLGMSVGNFQRVFKRSMHMSPKQFSLQLRLDNARNSLEMTQLPIDEIASRNGFADRYAFSKAFTKYFGCPPAAYRKGEAGESKPRTGGPYC